MSGAGGGRAPVPVGGPGRGRVSVAVGDGAAAVVHHAAAVGLLVAGGHVHVAVLPRHRRAVAVHPEKGINAY